MTERAGVRGHHFDNRAVLLYRLRDDKIVEVVTLDREWCDSPQSSSRLLYALRGRLR
jgi:ketosteroid isomerase-like protein